MLWWGAFPQLVQASAECFRTTAAAVESSPVFFHYQDRKPLQFEQTSVKLL